ncbi:MAG: hypothetical protein U1A24_06990 [Cypionkella sp.]|uniref:hypothetical protein n=1 Tax=Cypionkella sp. TaxID=2811411 RepID=UPI002ABA590F|nr:hypothetical protein [Cypionkella sp.]MDZ4310285.1 hypothetical protein [Cypionkella sp.]
MTLPDLFLSQLSDPFRIGLLIALFITMLRTRAASGTWVPLAAGVVFVAVILPTTVQTALAAPLAQVIGVGVVVNVVIVALIMAVWEIYQRARR